MEMESDSVSERVNGIESESKLKRLSVRNNNLSSIQWVVEHSMFCNLRELDFGCNAVSDLSPFQNTPLSSLRVLAMDSNKVHDVLALRSMSKLVELDVAYNVVVHSDNIYSLSFALSNLAILSLRGNVLCDEVELWRFYVIFCLQKSLRMLDGESITTSEMEAAAKTFWGRLHRDLLVRKMGHNHFARIQALDLSNCDLLVLDAVCPLNATTFTALKQLILSGNQLSDLSDSPILELHSLRDLDLSHNEIDKLPVDAFGALVHLQSLRLSANKIESISDLHLFPGLCSLETLELDHNKMGHLDANDIVSSRLPKLCALSLSDNKISKLLHSGTWTPSNVQRLNLQNNRLRALHDFDRCFPNLRELDLDMNRIQNLSASAFLDLLRSTKLLYRVHLEMNPIFSSHRRPLAIQQIVKHSDSVQFVGDTELKPIRQQIRVQQFIKHNPPNNVLSDTNNDRNDNVHRFEANPSSSSSLSIANHNGNAPPNTTSSSSTIVPLLNPIGLKIQKIKQTKAPNKRRSRDIDRHRTKK